MRGNNDPYPLQRPYTEHENPSPPSISPSPSSQHAQSPSSQSISYHQHNYPYDYELPGSTSQSSSSSPYSVAVSSHRFPVSFYDRDHSVGSYQTRSQSYASPDAGNEYLDHEHREYSREHERERPGPIFTPLHAIGPNAYPMPSHYEGEDYSYPAQYSQQSSPYFRPPELMSVPRPNDYHPRTLPQPPGLPLVSPSAHVPTSHERGGGRNITADSDVSITAGPNLPTGYGPYGRNIGNVGPSPSPSLSIRGRYIESARPPGRIPPLPHNALPSHDDLQQQHSPVSQPQLHPQSQATVPSQLDEDLRSFGSPSSVGYEEYDPNISVTVEITTTETSAMGARGRGTRRVGNAKKDSGDGTPPAERKGGRKTENACYFCRRRKLKCDGARPCNNCGRRGTECQYDETVKRRGPGKKNKKSNSTRPASSEKSRSGKRQQSSTSTSQTPPAGGAPPEEMQATPQVGDMPERSQSLGAGPSDAYITHGGRPGMRISTPPPRHHISPQGARSPPLHPVEGGEGKDWADGHEAPE
ncbi:hypothetical protein BS47DRAFT_1213221 [Hydnum rufescens UP504]|uniref:Zn(2)-C6 fungal-type domain-containing protein n=1 Tax=Hydnum rufescens UP504 TaxID=1448309 RepID=A0A9P6ASM7_9AGAM|nr:hypothetical protein BS47DRAFT_1213221 [Hydnum rufescens UP504]